MSQRRPTDHERKQIKHKCPVCLHEPGEWCTTSSGQAAVNLHVGRPSSVVQELPPRPPTSNELKMNQKIAYAGWEWDVNNIINRNIVTNHINGEQDVELTVVLTRKIPKQGDE